MNHGRCPESPHNCARQSTFNAVNRQPFNVVLVFQAYDTYDDLVLSLLPPTFQFEMAATARVDVLVSTIEPRQASQVVKDLSALLPLDEAKVSRKPVQCLSSTLLGGTPWRLGWRTST